LLLGADLEGGHTKSIESLDDVASLLPKGILVQAMMGEAVHLLRFSFNEILSCAHINMSDRFAK